MFIYLSVFRDVNFFFFWLNLASILTLIYLFRNEIGPVHIGLYIFNTNVIFSKR